MEVIRDREIGKVKVTLKALDQFNDYSVLYDHYIDVNYGNGRGASFNLCTTNRAAAIKDFDAAVALVWKHKAMEVA